MISANGGLPAHRYTPQVTERWPRGSEPVSLRGVALKVVTGTAAPESIVRGLVLMVMTQDAAPETIRRGAVLQVTNALTAVAAPESNVSVVASSGPGNSLVMLLMS